MLNTSAFLSPLIDVLPEVWVLSTTTLIILLSVFLKNPKKTNYFLSSLTFVGLFVLSLSLIQRPTQLLFNNMFVADHMAYLLKGAMGVIGFFIFLYTRSVVLQDAAYKSEYFILILFSLLGMMVLVSSKSFLTLYLGLELFALPLYALIPILGSRSIYGSAPEASLKYFVVGALASGLLLYGISLFYGITGHFGLLEVSTFLSQRLAEVHYLPPVLLIALVFVLVGLGFKFGLVPFHNWLPDVYEGAPASITLFIGTLPKLAAFGLAFRLLNDTLSILKIYWQPLLMIMAVLSLAIGNIVALKQTNLKRLLGYSTIAHMGFLFLGWLTGTALGMSAALNYALIYVFMALGALGVIVILSHEGFEPQHMNDFKGFGKQYPLLAFMMLFLLLSLAGIPPFAGFYAKLFVLNALIEAGHIGLSVLAVLLTVVGAYYYLRVVRVMFFEEPDSHAILSSLERPFTKLSSLALSINGIGVLMLGIFPAVLLSWCQI